MTVWGGIYLYQCYMTLSQPGVPMELEYSTETGTRVFRAESFVIDPWKKSVELTSPGVSDDEGGRVLSADRIHLVYDAPVLRVETRSLAVRLRREATGRFDIQSFLPKSEPGKFGPAYTFAADQVVLDYTDLQGTAITHRALVKGLSVSQDKGDLCASGLVTVPGLQPAPLVLQIAPDDRTWLQFPFLNGDAKRLLPLAVRFLPGDVQKQIDRLQLTDLDVSGRLDLVLVKGSVGVAGDLRFRSSRLVYDRGAIAGKLDGTLVGSRDSSRVAVSLQDGANRATFDGRVAFAQEVVVAGDYSVRTGDRLWPLVAKQLPKGVAFRRLQAAGWIGSSQGKLSATGRGRVDTVSAQGERFSNLVARFSYNGALLRADVDRAEWRGGSLNGSVLANVKTKQVQGVARLPERSLDALLATYGVKTVTGRGSATALIAGRFDTLQADLYAQGKAVVQSEKGIATQTGPFEARLALAGQVGTLKRLTVSGPNGILVADGRANLKSRALDARFIAGAVPLSLVNAEANGVLFAQGRVKGTLDNPSYEAHVEGYGLEFKDQGVPLLVAEVDGDRNQLEVTSLQANSGTGLLDGIASINLKTKGITGKFDAKNLSLSQFFGSSLLGAVDVSQGQLAGTYDDPRLTARVKGQKLYAYGSRVDAVDLFLAASLDELRVTDGEVRVGEGVVRGTATYAMDTKEGRASATASDLPLNRLLHPSAELAFDGRAGGSFEASSKNGVWSGSGTLGLTNVTVNETPLGAGSIDLSLADQKLSATGVIGSIDRYFGLDAFEFDLEKQSATSDFSAYNLRVRDLVGATRPIWDNGSPESIDLMETLDGSFTGKASVSASRDSWSLGDSSLTFSQLQIGGRDAGSLTGKISRSCSVWRASDVLWKSGPSTLTASGTYDEAGLMDVKADLNDFDLTWIGVFAPSAPNINGQASIHVEASGPKDDPSGRATVFVNNATIQGSNARTTSDPIQLFLDNVTFGNKTADLSGQANFSGFSGALAAHVPYSSLQSGSRSRRREPLTARLNFKERPIQDFEGQLPDVDMSKSDGNVQLSAIASGLIEDLKINANASFTSQRLAFKAIETELLDSSLVFSQNDRKVSVVSKGRSSQGGSFDVNLNGNLADIFGSNFNLDELFDESTIAGTAKFAQFQWAEKLMGAQAATVAKLDGNITVDGSLRSPRFGGDALVENLVLNLPSEIAPSGGGSLPINPVMDNIRLQIAQGSRIETGVGALFVSGIGFLNGSLSEPNVNIPLRLDSGTFRLPSGRLVLEPGGTMVFNYSSFGGGDPVARVNLDIEGRTNVVSQRATGQYENYQVTINIRGNVLDERSLVLSATSDPGDLSQDEILALIGQRDLIQGIAQGVLGGSGDRGVFRDLIYSVALPNLSQNLTQGIAQGLDLDFVSVDYNPFDQFMLRAGKTIGKGLVLEAARQLQNTGFGPTKWEVKLVYRLPMADRFFSRVRFAFGLDQSVPYKFSVNWSRRF